MMMFFVSRSFDKWNATANALFLLLVWMGAPVVTSVNALSAIVSSGAAVSTSDGLDDFSYSAALVDVFYLLIASSAFSPLSVTFSLALAELSVLLAMFISVMCPLLLCHCMPLLLFLSVLH